MSAKIIDLDPAQARRRELVKDIREASDVEMAIQLLFLFEQSARCAGMSIGMTQAKEIYGSLFDEPNPPSAA